MAVIETDNNKIDHVVQRQIIHVRARSSDACLGSRWPDFCNNKCLNCVFPGMVWRVSREEKLNNPINFEYKLWFKLQE